MNTLLDLPGYAEYLASLPPPPKLPSIAEATETLRELKTKLTNIKERSTSLQKKLLFADVDVAEADLAHKKHLAFSDGKQDQTLVKKLVATIKEKQVVARQLDSLGDDEIKLSREITQTEYLLCYAQTVEALSQANNEAARVAVISASKLCSARDENGNVYIVPHECNLGLSRWQGRRDGTLTPPPTRRQ